MNNFFSTLFKVNWANAGKFAVGIAVAIVAANTAGLVLPAAIIGTATGVISMGTLFGIISGATVTGAIHAVHLAPPPDG